MQICSIHLKNIRSYIDEKITFTLGKTLLQGDIGSGKSTVLLAIEFALFGLLRGTVGGGALLRHSERTGIVTLEFKTEGHHVFIRRSLKRSKTSIDQSEGVFIDNGVLHNLTPTELKVKILDILGYPADLLTKSKSLMYRYTVYTPQEQMKRILYEKPETRINIFRKVFDIDKYKRIQDNLAPYARTLREKQKECEVYISEMSEKVAEFTQCTVQIEDVAKQLGVQQIELKKLQDDTAAAVLELQGVEKEMHEQQSIVQKVALLEAQMKNGLQRQDDLAARATVIEKEVGTFEPFNPEDLAHARSGREKEEQSLANVRKELQEINTRVSVCASHISQSQALKGKISQLSQCPSCLQTVTVEHKQVIDEKESDKISRMEQKSVDLAQGTNRLTVQMEQHQQVITHLRQQEQQLIVLREKQEHMIRLQKERAAITQQLASLVKEGVLQKESIAQLILQKKPNIQDAYTHIKSKSDLLHTQVHQSQLRVATLTQKQSMLRDMLSKLGHEVEKKKNTKRQLQSIKKSHDWLTQYFSPLISTMEKHVLTRIYHGFNDLFVDWFKQLVQDDIFSARLDDQFTPIIEQNGYETSFDNLSGGEKTACALAYRLALTKVINSLITNIKTDELLILDEPTDGFSSQQLDRMREVLDHLGLEQVIIVSHERKIESFVDHVIRIEKQENVSHVV
jgi:exonuclease SbcC